MLTVNYYYQYLDDYGFPQAGYFKTEVEEGSQKHMYYEEARNGKTVCGCEYIKTQSIS